MACSIGVSSLKTKTQWKLYVYVFNLLHYNINIRMKYQINSDLLVRKSIQTALVISKKILTSVTSIKNKKNKVMHSHNEYILEN